MRREGMKKALTDVFKALQAHETWELVQLSADRKVIKTKWVSDIRRN